MSQDHRLAFINSCDAELALLTQQLYIEITEHTGEHRKVGQYADPADRATAECEHQEDILLHIERPQSYLRKVQEARVRIRSGTYGYCQECGEWIGDERLKARPTATLCIHCKTIEETVRERQYGVPAFAG